MLVYWGLVSLPGPLSLGQGQCSISWPPCCQHVVMFCWLFFNFAVSFDFRCCSLAQEMSFVDHYLPYFMQRLITHPLSALLPFQPFLLKVCAEIRSLLSPFLWCTYSIPPPLLCVSFQFHVYSVIYFFLQGGVNLSRGLCWFIPGVTGVIPHDTWCLPVGLP
jgi:hypothetical protein